MKYPRITREVTSDFWAIEEGAYRKIKAILAARNDGIKATPADKQAAAAARRSVGNGYYVTGGVGVVQIMGVLHNRADQFTDVSGGIGCEDIARQFDLMLTDSTVKKIVMQVDSPGGSVFGTSELADKIRAGRDVKKVIAVADPVAASGAFWLAASASELYVTPSGMLGSVGVICEHVDESEADKMEGRKVTLIRSTPFKQETHSSQALTAEAAADQQKIVDSYYNSFLSAVAKGRGVSVSKVEKDFGQGRMLTSSDARAAGMCDGIATFQTIMKRLTGQSADATGGYGSSAAMANARLKKIQGDESPDEVVSRARKEVEQRQSDDVAKARRQMAGR